MPGSAGERFAAFVSLGDSDAESIDFASETISFTTASADPQPRTLYVAFDGDNSQSGLSRSEAWRTINRAANQVRPGDTVLIGEGIYHETVRIRTTGDEGARITFKAHPGEQVILDGSDKQLQGAFMAINHKDHLDFDGFYVRDFARGSMNLGAFGLVRSSDIQITRIFHDGREQGSDAELLTASHVDNLLVKNCVSINGWDAIGIGTSTNVRIENNVLIRPFIRTIPVGGIANRQDIQIKNNVITDNLANKRHVFLVPENVVLENNCFFLRSPEAERSIFGEGGIGLAEYNQAQGLERGNFAAAPEFAVFESDSRGESEKLLVDNMILEINDFSDVFATSPTLIDRGVGLIRADFADFHFRRSAMDE